MSAIEKDRQIAAQATQGEWRTPRAPDTTPGGSYWHGYIWSVLYERRIANPVYDVDAEHIVRLHNRQPLYDALADAASMYYDQLCRYRAGDSSWPSEGADTDALMLALRALDAEQEDRP